MPQFTRLDEDDGLRVFYTELRGMDLLNTPLLNKDAAFPQEERDRLGLNGLLPPQIVSLDEQVERMYEAYRSQADDLQQHIFLRALQDRNEVLFYALARRHLAEMMRVLYMPTIAQGCRHFQRIYRKPRGLFISYPLRDRMAELLSSRPFQDIDLIVVTDGERTLGAGDQGAGGLCLSIGKLSLYSLLGGIHPSRTLPLVLDAGTNNAQLLSAPLYPGWRHERVSEEEYFAFVEDFIVALIRTMPDVLVQWEDLPWPRARLILEKYSGRLCTFSDEVQGAAAAVLGAVYAGMRASGKRLRDQCAVIVGSDESALAIAEYLLAAMKEDGLTEEEARRRLYLQGKAGLIHAGMRDLPPLQRYFAQPLEALTAWRGRGQESWGLLDVVRHSGATILIGAGGEPGCFHEAVIRELARHTRQPVILPLAGADGCAEAVPEQLLRWTGGRALIATGSAFLPVAMGGHQVPIAQVSSAYIFPGVGLGVAACKASRVTEGMMMAAARALGNCSPAIETPGAPLLPGLEEPQAVAIPVALAVAERAVRDGLVSFPSDDLEQQIQSRFWHPGYPRIHAS